MSEQGLATKLRRQLRHAEYYWAPLLYGLAVYYLYREVFAGQRGFGWDTIETYWPDLVYLGESLAQGEWPLWNPFDRGGYPYSSDPQPGMFYPLHWLLAAIGMVTGDTGWSLIQFKMLLHHAIAGVCMHAFLRHRGLPRIAAIIGGMALIASTPWLIHKASNLLMPMVWTPLIWIATDRLLNVPTWRRSVALAASIYLAGSAGSPPGFFYVLVMALLYGGYRVIDISLARAQDKQLGPYLRTLAPLVVLAAILSVCLLWVSVAPGLDLAEFTPRAKRDLGYALSIPLPMWPTLRGLLVPTSGQVDAYVGVLVLLLAIAGLLLGAKRHRGTPVFFALASVLFLAMSFGGELPVLAFFVKHVPGFGLFRIASRYKCLLALMMAVLAGYGSSALLDAGARFSRDTWKIILLCLISAAGVAILLHWFPRDPVLAKRFPSGSTPIVLTLLAIGLLLASVLHNRRSTKFVLAAMPLLILGDPERYGHHQQSFLEAKVNHKEDLRVIENLPGVMNHTLRIYDEFVLEQRPGSRLRIRDFRGYPSGDPLDFQRYRDVLVRAGKAPRLLEAYNVGYILHGRHHRNGKRSNRLKQDPARQSPSHFERGKGQVRRALHPAPIVEWFSGVRIIPTNKVLDEVLASERDDGTRQFAVLEPIARKKLDPTLLTRLETLGAQGGSSRSGTLVSFSPDEVEIQINAPSEGLLILNEVTYPGWNVTVDGKPATSLRANYLLRAVIVPSGTHRIRWSYEPPGHSTRMLLYLLAMLALLGATLPWNRLRFRRESLAP